MVTAGIYLIARSSAIYLLAPIAMEIILYTGLTTTLIAAIIAVYQYDIKKHWPIHRFAAGAYVCCAGGRRF